MLAGGGEIAGVIAEADGGVVGVLLGAAAGVVGTAPGVDEEAPPNDPPGVPLESRAGAAPLGAAGAVMAATGTTGAELSEVSAVVCVLALEPAAGASIASDDSFMSLAHENCVTSAIAHNAIESFFMPVSWSS
jgi:hypothetical protein